MKYNLTTRQTFAIELLAMAALATVISSVSIHEAGHWVVCEYFDSVPTWNITEYMGITCNPTGSEWMHVYWAAGGFVAASVLFSMSFILHKTINQSAVTWGLVAAGFYQVFNAFWETFDHADYINGDKTLVSFGALIVIVLMVWIWKDKKCAVNMP